MRAQIEASGLQQSFSKTVYVIAGPTAVGKTAIAIALAERLGTAVISADSRQCYREMTIGTAKPDAAQLRQVKHYFIDTFPVTAPVTAAHFEALALGYLDKIFAHSDSAVVTGGTGLYLKALTDGLDDMPEVNPQVAEDTEAAYKAGGLPWLQETVAGEDPEFYRQAEIHNPARLLRALIFIRSHGKSINDYRTGTAKPRQFNIVKAGLELPRQQLYAHINKRVDQMMADGLLAEVQGLAAYRELKSLQTVGYSELFAYIDGDCTLQHAVDKIKQHTRNYAKRQMTWFKKDTTFGWLNAASPKVVDEILSL